MRRHRAVIVALLAVAGCVATSSTATGHAATGLAGPVATRAAARSAVARGAVTRPGIAAIPRGVVRVLAHVPSPGYPALPLVWGGDIYEGTYTAVSGSSTHSHVCFDQASNVLGGTDLDERAGKLYSVQISADGAPGAPKLLWTSTPGALPDGLRWPGPVISTWLRSARPPTTSSSCR